MLCQTNTWLLVTWLWVRVNVLTLEIQKWMVNVLSVRIFFQLYFITNICFACTVVCEWMCKSFVHVVNIHWWFCVSSRDSCRSDNGLKWLCLHSSALVSWPPLPCSLRVDVVACLVCCFCCGHSRLLASFAFHLSTNWELPQKRVLRSDKLRQGVRDMLITHHLFSWDL